MAGFRTTSGGQTAATASGYVTSLSVTTAFSTAPQVNDILMIIAFDAYASAVPTITVPTGVGTILTTTAQPTAIVASKKLTATGQVTVTATVPSVGMLYLFVFSTFGYTTIDDVEFGADNTGTEGTVRNSTTSMIAPSTVASGASTGAPDQLITALCTFYDGVTTTPTITAPSGSTSMTTSTTPAAAGGYGTMAKAYTYATTTANGTVPAKTATANRAVYSTNLSLLLRVNAPPASTPLSALTDPFAGSVSATTWPTRNYVTYDSVNGCAAIGAGSSGGSPQYAAMRSALAYTFVGSGLTFQAPHFPDAAGDTVSSQVWIQPDQTPGVNRIGFEYVGATNTLVFRGQTTGYAAIGTDVSIPYNALCRWLRITYDTTNGIQWYTSPDGVNWILQRTLAAASVPAWCGGTNTLQASFEAYRTTGVNDNFLVDNVNLPPGSAVLPTWIISTAPIGKTTWVADLTKADAVAAGYQNMNWNIEPSGIVTFPPPVVPAPYGRTGGAARLRLPDAGKRNELQPDGIDYQDGDSFWEGLAFCLGPETDLQATAGSGYQVIWQLRPENDTGSPPLAIEVRNGQLLLTGGYNRPDATGNNPQGGTYSYSRTLLSSVKTATWYRIVIFVGVWSDFNSGRVDIWVNDASVLSNFVPPPGTNYPQPSGSTPTGSYLKCGVYHDIANRGMTNYIADHKIGTSYTAVAPPATPQSYGGLELAAAR